MSDGVEANEPVATFGNVVDFSKVFESEITLINRRRHAAKDPRGQIAIEIEAHSDLAGERVLRPKEEAAVVGLALSGGGIRSAAFCLGALQAMHEAKALDRVDYLSTVSGGGYIGCSLTAGLEATRGSFPFTSRLVEDETPSLQHLRDHSNYLFSNGAVDLLHNASIYGRGADAAFDGRYQYPEYGEYLWYSRPKYLQFLSLRHHGRSRHIARRRLYWMGRV